MRIVALACFSLVLGLGSATSGVAAGDPAPYEAMRSLQALQDRIANGDAIAQAAHAKAILRTGRVFAAAKPTLWQDGRNARALITYLFSGGSATGIAGAIAADLVAPEVKTLYEGALAYGLGDDDTARARLMPIDAKSVPSGLAGHLALVQATLIAAADAPKAIALLDTARLLEPGTLVEEAALRKEMSLIGASGDLDKFSLLSRRYLGGFPHSIYIDNFRGLVAQAAMQLGAGNSDEAGRKLAKLMGALDKVERRRLYLAIARQSLLAGRMSMTALAGNEAARLAGHDDPDAARAAVYIGAAAIVGDKYDAAVTALSEAAPSHLDARDRALRLSALAVADVIRKPPSSPEGIPERGQADASLLADAERSLQAADNILKDPK